jgi:hypothetical protein
MYRSRQPTAEQIHTPRGAAAPRREGPILVHPDPDDDWDEITRPAIPRALKFELAEVQPQAS